MQHIFADAHRALPALFSVLCFAERESYRAGGGLYTSDERRTEPDAVLAQFERDLRPLSKLKRIRHTVSLVSLAVLSLSRCPVFIARDLSGFALCSLTSVGLQFRVLRVANIVPTIPFQVISHFLFVSKLSISASCPGFRRWPCPERSPSEPEGRSGQGEAQGKANGDRLAMGPRPGAGA